MALTQAVKELKKEQQRLQAELQQVSNALDALNTLGGNGRRRGMAANGRRRRRKMSAAGRARIAAAQRARWAKLKAKKAIR
jgi:hypothetical protein